MKDYFTTLVRYHGWATRKLYEYVDALSDDEYRRDVGLFFKSVHGTLNHLLVAELIWLPRFAQGISPRRALNEEVETNRQCLRERLLDAPAQWQPVIDALDGGKLHGRIDYTTTQGVPTSLPFAATLGHVFNHATHHRGQISAAITGMGHPCPEIDLVRMLQAESRA
ncbi:MAG TPA: DinB family protein [Albitalea sp.]|nr:DinB family protein [Albitalea sp.]